MAAVATSSSNSLHSPAATSPYRVPLQLPRSNARKSPPMAFEKTSNDSLAPLISPHDLQLINPFESMSPSATNGESAVQFQTVIDKQSTAIQALHTAFAAEREAWSCERRSLLQRITSLEKLLKAQGGHSPARSPIVSPNESVSSPQTRALSNPSSRLASILEDENTRPLSDRRDGAPRAIDIPAIKTVDASDDNGRRDFDDIAEPVSALDELSVSPPRSIHKLSPPPPENRVMAGHTPHKTAVRPPTPPPRDMMVQGIEDTPTRNNTHINALLTKSNDEEEDRALTGPLNMPELPSKPKPHNFTEEMLLKKLERIAQDPKNNKPTIFSIPSPGLAIDEDGIAAGLSPATGISTYDYPLAPIATRDVQSTTSPEQNPISPTSGLQVDADRHDQKFEQGGIRLKKKPSTNFGVPFGQLGGFVGIRRMS